MGESIVWEDSDLAALLQCCSIRSSRRHLKISFLRSRNNKFEALLYFKGTVGEESIRTLGITVEKVIIY